MIRHLAVGPTQACQFSSNAYLFKTTFTSNQLADFFPVTHSFEAHMTEMTSGALNVLCSHPLVEEARLRPDRSVLPSCTSPFLCLPFLCLPSCVSAYLRSRAQGGSGWVGGDGSDPIHTHCRNQMHDGPVWYGSLALACTGSRLTPARTESCREKRDEPVM